MSKKKLLEIKNEIETKLDISQAEELLLEFIKISPKLDDTVLQTIVIAYKERKLDTMIIDCSIIVKPESNRECTPCGRTLKDTFICPEAICPHKT